MERIDPAVDREFDATLETCGRVMGYCLSLILDKGVKSGEALSQELEAMAYDRCDRLQLRSRAVLLGIMEGISIATHGDKDARL